jgi:glycosyltransferase involved in cell wall biosynthesis
MRLLQRERSEGVKVYRVAHYPSHDSSAFGRVLNYLTFALTSAITIPFIGRGADVVYVYHPPGTTSFPALVLRLLRKIPFVIDIQDLWPDTLAATGMIGSRRILGAVNRWMNLVYRMAGAISVLSEGFREKLIERGVPTDKIHVIYNWAPENPPPERKDESTWQQPLKGRFNVVYAGNLGKAQALEEVLKAAARVAKSESTIQFVFIGEGIESGNLKAMAQSMGLTNVLFLPRMPFDEIVNALAAADVLLVHLPDDPLFAITIPSKTQAYLAAGRPIVMAVRGEAADLVEKARAGIRCRPSDPEALAAAVRSIHALSKQEREEMGHRGRAFYEEHLSLDTSINKLELCLREAALSLPARRSRGRRKGALGSDSPDRRW